jgi:hypothetical protein
VLDAGVVYQEIDRTKLGLHLSNKFLERRGIGHVGRYCNRAHTVSTDSLGRLLESLGRARSQGKMDAAARQMIGQNHTHSARRAGQYPDGPPQLHLSVKRRAAALRYCRPA